MSKRFSRAGVFFCRSDFSFSSVSSHGGQERELKTIELGYRRISVYPIEVPPLREQGGDISLLTGHFWSKRAPDCVSAPPA